MDPGATDQKNPDTPTEIPLMNQEAHPARSGGPLSGPLGIFVFVLLFSAAGYLAYQTLTNPPIPDPVPEKTDFVCTETHKHFEYAMKMGEKWPVPSPFSGKISGYPAETCYWTRDGNRKSEPT